MTESYAVAVWSRATGRPPAFSQARSLRVAASVCCWTPCGYAVVANRPPRRSCLLLWTMGTTGMVAFACLPWGLDSVWLGLPAARHLDLA